MRQRAYYINETQFLVNPVTLCLCAFLCASAIRANASASPIAVICLLFMWLHIRQGTRPNSFTICLNSTMCGPHKDTDIIFGPVKHIVWTYSSCTRTWMPEFLVEAWWRSYCRSSAGLTIVASVAIAKGPALLGASRFFLWNLVFIACKVIC